MGAQESKFTQGFYAGKQYERFMTLWSSNWLPGLNLGPMISKQIFDYNVTPQDDLPIVGGNVLIENMYLVHLVIIIIFSTLYG